VEGEPVGLNPGQNGYRSRRYNTPRVFFREWSYRGKFFSQMLGVAFTSAQAQKFHEMRRNYSWWSERYHNAGLAVTVRSEKCQEAW